MSQTVYVQTSMLDHRVVQRACALFGFTWRWFSRDLLIDVPGEKYRQVRLEFDNGSLSYDSDYACCRQFASKLEACYSAAQMVMAAEANGWSHELSTTTDGYPVVNVDMPDEVVLAEVTLV